MTPHKSPNSGLLSFIWLKDSVQRSPFPASRQARSLLISGTMMMLLFLSCQQRPSIDSELFRAKLYPTEGLEDLLDTTHARQNILKLAHKGHQVDSLLVLADRMKDFDAASALYYADAAYQLATQENWDLQRAISLYYIALMKRSLQTWGGGIEDALVDAEMSSLLFERLGRKDWQIRVYDLIGIIHYRQYEIDRPLKLDTARYYFQKALSTLETTQLSKEDSIALTGEIFQDLGNTYLIDSIRIAKNFFEESDKSYRHIGNQLGLARLWLVQGDILEKETKFEKADSLYQLTEIFALENKTTNLLIDVYLRQSVSFLNHYRRTRVPHYFNQAKTVLKKRIAIQKKDKYHSYDRLGITYQTKAANLYRQSQKQSNSDSIAFYFDEAYVYLDSALFFYKLAMEGARSKGILTFMDNLSYNIYSNCLDKGLNNKGDCKDIFEEKIPRFISRSYKMVADHMTINSVQANRRIREMERLESDRMSTRKRRNLTIASIIVLLLSGLVFLVFLQRAEQKKLRAQMEALRAQINPHFISNSLNAIENLVNQGENKAAAKYLISFSRLSRRILNSSREPETTLAQEIETLKHFLALEQLRFRDKLQYHIELAENLPSDQVLIPAMVLQPYIENAIWHGIKPKTGPGQLHIWIERKDKQLNCIIEDDGIGRKKSQALQANSVLKHKSQGMKITEERLKAAGRLKGSRIEIIDLKDKKGKASGTRVVLSLPLKFKKL